jgi:hypothetical protein
VPVPAGVGRPGRERDWARLVALGGRERGRPRQAAHEARGAEDCRSILRDGGLAGGAKGAGAHEQGGRDWGSVYGRGLHSGTGQFASIAERYWISSSISASEATVWATSARKNSRLRWRRRSTAIFTAPSVMPRVLATSA